MNSGQISHYRSSRTRRWRDGAVYQPQDIGWDEGRANSFTFLSDDPDRGKSFCRSEGTVRASLAAHSAFTSWRQKSHFNREGIRRGEVLFGKLSAGLSAGREHKYCRAIATRSRKRMELGIVHCDIKAEPIIPARGFVIY